MFKIGISRASIALRSAHGMDRLNEAAGVSWKYLEEATGELRADQIDSLDTLLLGGAHITSATFNGVDRLAVIARFGLGYDRVDVDACTEKWCDPCHHAGRRAPAGGFFCHDIHSGSQSPLAATGQAHPNWALV